MKSSSSNHVKQSKLKGFIFGVTFTFCAVVGIGQALAVINVSSILDKVPGTGLSLSEINAIIGTIRGISNDSGKIGIGTTAPNAELDVNGNIIAASPSANNHVATKEYVDASAGSSGGITYFTAVSTTASYTGNMGGYYGARNKCINEFGSTALLPGDIEQCAMWGTCVVRGTGYGWYVGKSYNGTGSQQNRLLNSSQTSFSSYIGAFTSTYDCNNWTSGLSHYNGNGVSNIGGVQYSRGCEFPAPLICVVPAT